MAKYMLLIYSDIKRWADVPEAEQQAINSDYYTFTQELVEAGVMAGDEAAAAYRDALARNPTAPERRFLEKRLADLSSRVR